MRIYSKAKEKLLSYIGYQMDPEQGISWRDIFHTYLQAWAGWFVNADQIFERGLDIEELTLVVSGDIAKAWEAAEPYYNAARSKGHAKAFYRLALHWGETGHSEFAYSYYLEGAAKRGYMPAVRDFVNYYEEFKVKTITRDAWKRKRRQERILFSCGKLLTDGKDPHAMWKWGTCYLLGTGVKADASKGLAIRDRALALWDLDEDSKAVLVAEQKFYKENAIYEREPFIKLFFTTVKDLFAPKKNASDEIAFADKSSL